MSDDNSDKSEQPSEKRLEDARQKGQVAQSKDLTKFCMLASVAEIAFISESWWRQSIHTLMDLALSRIGQPFRTSWMALYSAGGTMLLIVFFTFFIVCIIVATAASWGQFGMLFTAETVTPNFDKLNPVNGFKQIFTKKKVKELFLTMFKAAVIGFIVYVLVRDHLPAIVSLSGGEPKDIYFGFISFLRSVFHIILGVCLVLAVMDFAVQRQAHIKSLMMDREDMKKEYKESEGDPMVKGKRKQLARELANEAPAAKTEKANAVVVNPTHFAVAMLYEPTQTPVPMVLAKGKDEVAQAMILRARECGIPVIRHVWLARTLYATCRPDTVVPKSSYEAVAHVYAVVQELYASNQVGMHIELENYGDPPESYNS